MLSAVALTYFKGRPGPVKTVVPNKVFVLAGVLGAVMRMPYPGTLVLGSVIVLKVFVVAAAPIVIPEIFP